MIEPYSFRLFHRVDAGLAGLPSCWPVPPLQPIAPTILPPTTIGMPPSEAMMPSSVSAGQPRAAGGDAILEHLGGAAEDRGGLRLVLRNRDRGELAIVHPLEVDEIAGRRDDGDAHRPAVLLGFVDGGRGGLLRGFDVERFAIRRRRRLVRARRRRTGWPRTTRPTSRQTYASNFSPMIAPVCRRLVVSLREARAQCMRPRKRAHLRGRARQPQHCVNTRGVSSGGIELCERC